MPHGESWLSYFPGYHSMEETIGAFGSSWLFHGPVHAQHLAAILLTALVMLLLSIRARAQLLKAQGDILPDRKLTARNVVELMMEGLLTIMQFAMHQAASIRHFWIIGTLGFFILFSNLLGLIPGFIPPTENFNTTFACGTIVFVYYNFQAFRRLGLGHLAHMANPVGEWWGWFLAWLFLPVEVISHCIRPVSLSRQRIEPRALRFPPSASDTVRMNNSTGSSLGWLSGSPCSSIEPGRVHCCLPVDRLRA